MNNMRPFCLFPLALLLALLTSCAFKFKEDTARSDAAIPSTPQHGASAQKSANTVFERHGNGTINNKYQIAMTLRRNGANLEGQYFYLRVGKDLQLKGTVRDDGSFELTEFDVKGNATGVFRGTNINDTRWSGTWSKPNSTRPMPFYLETGEGAAANTTSAPAPSDFRRSLVAQLVRDGDIDRDCGANPPAEIISVEARDLNQDGQPEYLIEGSSCACGGAGSNCLNWVYRNNDGKYEKILGSELSQSGTGLAALKTRSNGWAEISAVAIGAARVTFITYRFNGQSYRAAKCEECDASGGRCHPTECY